MGVKGASSRGICYTQRSLEIFERLGIYDRIATKGIQWSVGRTFAGKDEVYSFDLRQQSAYNLSSQPPFINIQQFYIEGYLVERIQQLGHVELRWNNRVTAFEQNNEYDGQVGHRQERDRARPGDARPPPGRRRHRRRHAPQAGTVYGARQPASSSTTWRSAASASSTSRTSSASPRCASAKKIELVIELVEWDPDAGVRPARASTTGTIDDRRRGGAAARWCRCVPAAT